MQFIDPLLPAYAYKKLIKNYGGAYSFWEIIKMRGHGSPPLEYVSGLTEFDQIHYTELNEKSVCNIELLREAMIIRINKSRQRAVAIERLEQLRKISFERAILDDNIAGFEVFKLTVFFQSQEPIVFHVTLENREAVIRYFSKKPWRPFFDHIF